MPKPYSDDLRERVIEAVEAGASRREAADSFNLCPSSAVKWLQRWRDTGSTKAKPTGGSRSRGAALVRKRIRGVNSLHARGGRPIHFTCCHVPTPHAARRGLHEPPRAGGIGAPRPVATVDAVDIADRCP